MGDMFGCGYERSYQEGQGKTLIICLMLFGFLVLLKQIQLVDTQAKKILYYRLSEVSGTKKLAADPLKPVIREVGPS